MSFETSRGPRESQNPAPAETVQVKKMVRVSQEPALFFGEDPVAMMKTALNVLRNPESGEARKQQAQEALRSEGIEYDAEMDQKNPEILEDLLARKAQAAIGNETRAKHEAEVQAVKAEEERIRAKIARETQQAMAPEHEQWKPEEPKSFVDKLRKLFR